MTGDIVNLRRVRKARAKTEAEQAAAANRAAFGRSRAEKIASEAARQRADARLSGHCRTEADEP